MKSPRNQTGLPELGSSVDFGDKKWPNRGCHGLRRRSTYRRPSNTHACYYQFSSVHVFYKVYVMVRSWHQRGVGRGAAIYSYSALGIQLIDLRIPHILALLIFLSSPMEGLVTICLDCRYQRLFGYVIALEIASHEAS